MSRTGNQTRRKLELRRRLALAPWAETLETRQLLASFQVFDPGDTNTLGTLRYAINQVNADPNDSPSAPDLIDFNLPGSGQQTITLTSPLPAITNPVVIDGYSQPGSSTNSTSVGLNEQETDLAVLNVRIDGSGVTPTAAVPGLLTVIASNTTVDGLSLTNFNGPAIALLPPPNSPTGSVGDDIWGNFIGVTSFNPDSFNDLPLGPNSPVNPSLWAHINPTGNTVGILVQSSNNRIGGSLPPSRNVIQGNHGDGVQLTTATGTGNLVEGNYILDNDANGVYITTSNNLIGEAIGAGPAGAGNVISGNNYGVSIVGPSATGNILVNNEIGTEVGLENLLPPIRGMNPRPNRYDGVSIVDAPGNIVGGQISNSRNVIAANGRDGVSIQNVSTQDATGNVVEGNYIGFNLRGGRISILPNRDGINISSANNTIGGTTLAARNEIAANARNGITITSMTLDSSNLNPVPIPNADPTGNFVAGNFIGTEGGADDYGNTYNGVMIEDAHGNSIGGSVSGSANVISGNNNGVVINDDTAGHTASTGNIVSGNIIGLMSDNRTPLPNSVDGVLVINASNNTIGGTVTAADNVLSGNNNGLHLTGPFATSNVVIGNFVGTDITGTFAARNSVDGILIDNGASANTIGGTSTATRNIISGNGTGVAMSGATSTQNIVVGNYIGVANDGKSALPNSVDGVSIASPANTIGGTVAAAANVISGNFVGLYITGGSARLNVIEGNLIGTDSTGANAVKNTTDGVLLDGGAAGNTIGGAAAVDGNIIANNGGNGVNVVAGSGNTILSNQIDSNGLLGIAGTNGQLSAFTLSSVTSNNGTSTVITGVFTTTNATPAPFLLQFFINPANAIGYNYEGQTEVATQTVMSNGAAPTSFTVNVPSVLTAGQYVTFTATGPDGTTTVFSAGLQVSSATQPTVYTVYNTNDSGPGSLRQAILDVNLPQSALPSRIDQIVFAIPGSGQQTIAPASPFPAITGPVLIDGFSQPGSAANSLGVGFNGVYNIRLDGSNVMGASGQGLLTIAAINCQVRGLSITGYMNGPAILLAPTGAGGNSASSNIVSGNLIGVAVLNPNLSSVLPTPSLTGNLIGIEVQSSGNRIGGSAIGAGNVIEGNNGVGVQLDGASGTGNVLDGNAVVNNLTDGILIRSANNVIGEEIAPATNLIAGNGGNGIHIQGAAAKGNVVGFNGGANILVVSSPTSGIVGNFANGVLIEDAPGNIIETNTITNNVGDGVRVMNNTATTAIDNHILDNDIESNRDGVNISSSNNDVSQLNLIIANRRNGVTISTTDLDPNNNVLSALANNQASGNVIAGNNIGTRDGNAANGNTLEGVLINAAPDNTVGGTNADDRNIISGNNDGVVIRGAASVGNLLENNIIGAKGITTAVLPNAVDGVRIENAGNNTIGGTVPLAGNEISGNNTGIHLTGAGTTGNVVEGNYIGTDFLVGSPVRNSNNGILFDNNASNNTIGGTASGAANTIAFNVGSGVAVASGTGNAILNNSIFSNDRIGIDLVAPGDPANGVTPQQLVPTPGPNDLVNAPVIGFASCDGKNHTSIVGTFLGVSGGTYLLQFFSSPTADASGHGQGKTYLGSVDVTLTGNNPSQLVTTGFDAELKVNVPAGQFVSATATELSGNGSLVYGSTSEFSNVMPTASVTLGFSATSYTVDQAAGTATITVTRGGSPNAAQGLVSVDYTVGGGTAVPGQNYVPTSGTLTFNPGDVAKTIVIPIINNPAVAPSTTVDITLSNPTGAATINDPNPVTLTIANNNVASLQLSVASYAANETDGTATITVTRNTSTGSASVNYATSNGTALAGVDYTAVSGTLNFAPGQTSQTFTVPIVDAGKVGGSVSLNLNLSGASGAGLGTPATGTLTITDNEQAGALEFNNVSYGVNASASSALITVVRNGGSGGTVSVQYATGGGTAVPGQDYAPTSGVLTFGPGETIKSFSIPILNHSHFGNYTVGLTLSAPGGGASLGPIAGATLNISQNAGATLVKAGPQPGPVVTNFVLATNGPAITGLVLSFNEPLDPTRASNPANYGYYIAAAGPDNLFGTGDDGGVLIASASYNPATFQVILTPAAPLALGQLYKIGVNTLASVQLQTGLTDTQGNLLDGAYDGHSGSPYVATFALGSQIHYLDGSGNFVTLQLNRGGLLQLQAAGNGNAELVRVIGAVPGKSQLMGSVRGHRRTSTTIPFIQGAGGVKVRLPRSQFHIGQISAAAVDHILARHGRG